MYQHVVLISFLKTATENDREIVMTLGKKLGADCGGTKGGILSWKFEKNLDTRKGVHLVELATFASEETFQMFRAHPKHGEFVGFLRTVADWQVGDFISD